MSTSVEGRRIALQREDRKRMGAGDQASVTRGNVGWSRGKKAGRIRNRVSDYAGRGRPMRSVEREGVLFLILNLSALKCVSR